MLNQITIEIFLTPGVASMFMQKISLSVAFIVLSAIVIFHSNVEAQVNTGEPAPDFSLTTYEGKPVKLSDYRGKIVVLEWFNRGCPFVQKHYDSGNMQALQERYAKQGVAWITINSTRADHADYLTPEKAAKVMNEWKITQPLMVKDESGEVGKRYAAKTTPHMYVIAPDGKISFQGAIDDDSSVSGDPKKAKNFVAQAIDELMAGKPLTVSSKAPYGCTIKYAG